MSAIHALKQMKIQDSKGVPVRGVHQERVLSSKKRIFTIVSTLYQSATRMRPRPACFNALLYSMYKICISSFAKKFIAVVSSCVYTEVITAVLECGVGRPDA